MDKNKNETGDRFFCLRQERIQSRETNLRVDKKITWKDLIAAFNWVESNKVFWDEGESDWDDCKDFECDYLIIELPDANPEDHKWYNTCDISLNEDGTIKVKLPLLPYQS